MNKAQLRRRAAKRKAGKCATPFCRGTAAPEHAECSKCMMRRWRAKYPLKAAYSELRYRSRRRGISFTLTLGEFSQICADSGYLEGKGRKASELQIDRIDVRQGYSWANCQVLTCSENVSKGNRERFIHHDDICNEPF